MTTRTGFADRRKRPKRLTKKFKRNQKRHYGWRPQHVIEMTGAQIKEFARQLMDPPKPNEILMQAMALARETFVP